MAVNGGSINFQVNMSVGKSDLSSLIKPLQQIQAQANGIKLDGTQDQLLKAADAAKQLESILNQSWNSKLGQLNLSSFNQGITSAFTNVEGLRNALNNGGDAGRQAFNNIAHTVLNTNVQLKESNTLLDQMATSMANTVKWGITSSIFKTITGSIQQAFNYTKNLDTSLTNIRIVTGASADEMDRFAVAANKSAQELGRSTLEYTKAATAYYQQGLSDEQVKARTEITLKAQNITGAGSEMVDYLTSVWNGFKVTADEAEGYVDKLAKVADSSASDMSQLATAMSKVASTANIMGVDVDQLSAQLATVIATTRMAPEAVGTAFKTIYTRLNDIKIGADDAEISLGKYSGVMASLGFNVLDANGQLRDTGQVMEQIGSRWGELTKAQQVYLASTMGGQRQITQLIALFDNWTRYSDLLNVSLTAQGTLDEKNSRYLDSMAAHMQKLTTQAQRTYDVLFDTKAVNGFTDMFRGALTAFNDYIAGIGGGTHAFIDFGAVVANVFNKQIAQGIQNATKSFEGFLSNRRLEKGGGIDSDWVKSIQEQIKIQNASGGLNIQGEGIQKQVDAAKELVGVYQFLTKEQQQQANQIQQKIGLAQQELVTMQQQDNVNKANIQALETELGLQNAVVEKIQLRANSLKDTLQEEQNIAKVLNGIQWDIIDKDKLNAIKEYATQFSKIKQSLYNTLYQSGEISDKGLEQKLNFIEKRLQSGNIQGRAFQQTWQRINKIFDKIHGETNTEYNKTSELLTLRQKAMSNATEEQKKYIASLEEANQRLKQHGQHSKNIQMTIRGWTAGIQAANAVLGATQTFLKEGATGAEKMNAAFSGGVGAVSAVANYLAPGSGLLVQGAGALLKNILQLTPAWDALSKKLESDAEKIARAQQADSTVAIQQKQSNKNIANLQSLQEEWDKLSNKAGEYGRNIDNLTDEEKDRYYQLIDTFSQYNDSVIAGYDAQGNAIVKNNGVLKETIDLLKQQQKQLVKNTYGDYAQAIAAEQAKAAERYNDKLTDKNEKEENYNLKRNTLQKDNLGQGQLQIYAENLKGYLFDVPDLTNFTDQQEEKFKNSVAKRMQERFDFIGGLDQWIDSLNDESMNIPQKIRQFQSIIQIITELMESETYKSNFTKKARSNQYIGAFSELIASSKKELQDAKSEMEAANIAFQQIEEQYEKTNQINTGKIFNIIKSYDEVNKEWGNLLTRQDEGEMQQLILQYMDSLRYLPDVADEQLKDNQVNSVQMLVDKTNEYISTLYQSYGQVQNQLKKQLGNFDASKITGSFSERINTITQKVTDVFNNLPSDIQDKIRNDAAYKELWQTAIEQAFNLEPNSIQIDVNSDAIQINESSLESAVAEPVKTLAEQFQTSLQESFNGKNFKESILIEPDKHYFGGTLFNPQDTIKNTFINLKDLFSGIEDIFNEFLDPDSLKDLNQEQFIEDFIRNIAIGLEQGAKTIDPTAIQQAIQDALTKQQKQKFELHIEPAIDTDTLVDKLKNTKQLKDEEDEYLTELQSQNSRLAQLSQQVGRNDAQYINALQGTIQTQHITRLNQIENQKAFLESEIEKTQSFLDRGDLTDEAAVKSQTYLTNLQGQLNNAKYQQYVLNKQITDEIEQRVQATKEQLKSSEQQYKQQQKLSQSGKELSKNLQKEDYALTESDYDLIGQYAAKHAEIGETLKQFGPYSQEFAEALSKAAEEEEKITEESKEALLTDLERQKNALLYEEWEYNQLNLTEKAKAAAQKRAAVEGEIAKLIAEANGQLEKTLNLKQTIAQIDKNERDNQTQQAEKDKDEALDRMKALEDAETTSRKLQKREQDNSLSKEDFYNMQAFEAAHPQMQGQFGTDDYTAQFAKWAENTYNIINAQNQVKDQAIAANQTLIDNTDKSLKQIEDQLISNEDYEAARKRLQARQTLDSKDASLMERGEASTVLGQYFRDTGKSYTQEQQDQDLQLVKQYADQESLRDQRTSLLEQKKQAEYSQKEIASTQTVSTRDEDISADDVANKMDSLKANAKEWDISDTIINNKQALENLAESIARYDAAMERATKSAEDWKDALESGDPKEQAEAIDELKNAYQDVLDVPIGQEMPETFLKSAENAQLLIDEVNGVEGAYQKLQSNFHKEILVQAGIDEASFNDLGNEVDNLISQYQPEGIEVGASLDDTDFANALAALLSDTYSTAEQAQAALLALGFNGTVVEDTTTSQESSQLPSYDGQWSSRPVTFKVPKLESGGPSFFGISLPTVTTDDVEVDFPVFKATPDPQNMETQKENKNVAFKIEGLSKASGGNIKHKATNHRSPSSGGGGGGCFIAGTPISVLDGYKNIEDIKKGDIVLSYNTQFNRVECSIVLETMIHNVAESIYTLYIEDEQLIVTGIHKFLITRNAQRDWIQASDLREGDLVLFADGTWHEIHKISICFRHTLVYNFEVLENHNYFVGKNQILAHNKGGGGGSAKKAQKIDKPKSSNDRYRAVDKNLKSTSNSMKKLQDEYKKTFGKDSLKNLDKQLENIKEQVKYTKQKLELTKEEQEERQKELKEQGIKFDASGQISNYAEVTNAAYKKYADFVKEYNKASGEWQEENKERLEEYKKAYEKLINDIKQYDDFREMQAGLKDNLEDFANQEIQIQIDKLNLEVQLKLDTQQAERDFNDFTHRIAKRFSDSNLQARAGLDTQQVNSYLQNNGTIDTQTQHLNQLLQYRQEMQTTGRASVYGDDRASLEKDIKQTSEGLQSSLEELYGYYDDLNDIQMQYLEHTKDIFDAQNQVYDLVNSELQHQLALIELVYGDDAYNKMDKLYSKQVDNSQQQLIALKAQQDYYQQMMLTEQEALNKSGYQKGTVQYDQAIERIEAYKQQWINTTDQVNAAVQNAVQLSIQKYQNSINSTFASFEKALTGGKSLSYIGEEWQLMKKQSEMYLDNVNAIYQTDKLENAFKQAIKDNSGNLKIQKQLNEAMQTQLSYLRDKEKLTQYDIDRANKLLDIEVKRAALEQASQSKTQLRLRRDSQGNYSYQYAANQDDITNAAQQLEDARNDLYNFTKEAYQKNLDDYYSTFAEMQEKMKAVYLDTTLSAKERSQKIAMYQKYYGDMMYDYTMQNEQLKQDTTIESMRNLAYAWQKHKDDLNANEDAITVNYSTNQAQRKAATAALISGVQEDYKTHNEALSDLYDADTDTYKSDQTNKKDETDKMLGQTDTLWGKSVTDLEGKYGTDVTNFATHIASMSSEVGAFTNPDSADSMPGLFKTAFAGLDQLETNEKTGWDDMIKKNTEVLSGENGLVPSFKSGIQGMADKFKESIKSMEDKVNPDNKNGMKKRVHNIFEAMKSDGSTVKSKFEWVFKRCQNAANAFEADLDTVQENSGQHFKDINKNASNTASKVETLATKTGLLSTITDGFSTANIVGQLSAEKTALDQVIDSMGRYKAAHQQKINDATTAITNAQVKEESEETSGTGKKDLTEDNLIGIAALIANDKGAGNHGGWGDKTQKTKNGYSVRANRINSKFNNYRGSHSAAEAIADLVSYFVGNKAEYGVFSQSELESYKRRMQQSITAYGGVPGQRAHYSYSKFDTGGYTGTWGKTGKLAMLHEKELVLNQEDTKNILNAVQVNRKIADLMNNIQNNNLASQLLSKFNDYTEKLDQNVTITAHFPNVSSSIEIEKAFDNLTNRASQYALRR